MPSLWTLDDMARAMGAEPRSVSATHVMGVSIDTRTLATGEAFFAIEGENRDGHAFVADALKAGAAVCVVAKQKSAELPMGAPLLVVDDVLEGLRALAHAARARSNAQIVAVTGSVGKTGTKEALRIALGQQGETHASTASYNNHWGVPLSLARMPAAAKYGVFEIGMNHAGEIMPLTRMVRPHVAIVTTIAPVHLEFFESVEKIADAKAEILIGLEPIGTAILNRDNEYFDRLEAHAEQHGIKHVVSFGEHEDADARLIKIALLPDCSTVHASILGTEVTYRIGAPGRHLAMNSLAVLAAASVLGCDLALAALALSDFHAVIGRGARVELSFASGRAVLIDESYNANPASMRAALDLLGAAERGLRGRRIAVLGDMLELGPRGPDLHRALVDAIVANDIDLVYCAGPLMEELWRVLPITRRALYAKSAAELESSVVAAIAPGDAVMVKGSLGSRMTPIVNALIRHYATPDAAQ